MSSSSSDYLFVLAIDFGTTYSGYAFSARGDFKTDPLKISYNQAWNAGSQRHISAKTPTCVLLDKKQEFVSFGYEAENKYSNIVLQRKQNEFYFFHRFKMQLYRSESITSDMMIEDVTGKPVKAMNVFSESIKALKTHFESLAKNSGLEVKEKDIRYVLTVPAIWSDAAKQFMRKSAVMAGIGDDQLVLALEPEAASIFCQYLPSQQIVGDNEGMILSEKGMKYMIVDNGGGTCDITVHEKLTDGKLKELHSVSGADCGGTSVDQKFYQILVKIVGAPVLTTMKEEEPSAYLDLFREFEAVKRIFTSESDDLILMTIPVAVMNEICQIHIGEDFPTIIKKSSLKDQLQVRYDKMIMDPEMVRHCLEDACMKIVGLITNILKERKCYGVKIIILVGGFSECKFLQDKIRSQFPQCKVIVPVDPVLSVVKGAVLFGHRPDYIVSRIARYTYGTNKASKFDKDVHDKARRRVYYGKEYCKGTFSTIVKIGQEVPLGTAITSTSTTTKEFQSTVDVKVYRSTSEDPLYVDDPSCTPIGTLKITIPNPTKEERTLRETYIFGNTELKVTVVDKKSGETCTTSFDII